jgi:hypothetical protein
MSLNKDMADHQHPLRTTTGYRRIDNTHKVVYHV